MESFCHYLPILNYINLKKYNLEIILYLGKAFAHRYLQLFVCSVEKTSLQDLGNSDSEPLEREK